MSVFAVLGIAKPLIEKGLSIVDSFVEDKDKANELKAQLTSEINNIFTQELQSKADIIQAEANGTSWLQRNWRPMTMMVFVYIIAHNFIFAPIFSLETLPIPEHMWELLKLGIGGYIMGRTGEKMIKTWKDK